MPLEQVFWTDPVIDHIREHFIEPEEFEDVVENRNGEERSRSSDRLIVRGYTAGGRFLCCVYEWDPGLVLPVTASELHDDE